MGNKLKRFTPLVILAGAVLLGLGMHSIKGESPSREKVQPRPTVDVIEVKQQALPIQVRSQGTVSARRDIAWASEVSGRVTWVSPDFVEGNRIGADTALLRIDDTDYRVALAEAQAALATARLALEEERSELRRATAYRGDSASNGQNLRQPKLVQVEASFQAAEERVRQARRDLEATQIRAPFDAVIDGKQVDLGQYVTTGSPLFNLLSTDIAEVRLPVTAADIGFLRLDLDGRAPGVILHGQLGSATQRWRGELVRIEQRVDTQTRTFFVVAAVEQPYNLELHEAPLVLGTFVDAQIEGVTVTGISLPRAAIHDNRYVYRVVDDKLQRRDIEIYRREPTSVIVRQGLADGDRVVVTPLDLMVDGMVVSPILRPALLPLGAQSPEYKEVAPDNLESVDGDKVAVNKPEPQSAAN